MLKKLMLALGTASLMVAPVAAQTVEFNPNVRVSNYSNSSPIIGVLAQNVHGQTFTIMQGMTISPGYNRVLSFDDGTGHKHCTMTVGAVFANGTKAIRQNMNVCTTTNWKIYDLDNTVE